MIQGGVLLCCPNSGKVVNNRIIARQVAPELHLSTYHTDVVSFMQISAFSLSLTYIRLQKQTAHEVFKGTMRRVR